MEAGRIEDHAQARRMRLGNGGAGQSESETAGALPLHGDERLGNQVSELSSAGEGESRRREVGEEQCLGVKKVGGM